MITLRHLFITVTMLYGFLTSLALTTSVRNGRYWLTIVIMLVASPGVALFVWRVVQHGQPQIPSWKHMSWAAVGGDILILPSMMIIGTWGWKRMEHPPHAFWTSWWWFDISYLIGVASGFAFHAMGGPSNSHSANLGERLHDAPMAWTHDIGIFSALTTAAICTLVPLFFTHITLLPAILALGCFVIWAQLSVADNIRAGLPTTSQWYFNTNWTNVPYDW